MLCLISTGLFFIYQVTCQLVYLFTCQLVHLLLNRTLFLCYFVFYFPCLQATGSLVHLLLCLKKPLILHAAEAQSFYIMKNCDSQKDAACNSAFILSKHAAKRSQVFSPAFLIPLLYWRIKDGLIPALLAISVTLRKLKQLKNECKSYL